MRLSPEDLSALVSFAEGETREIDPEVLARLYSLHSTVERRVLQLAASQRSRIDRLQTRLERIEKRARGRLDVQEFGETGLDSHDVALALLYQLQQYKTYRLSLQRIMLILFEMYASWLGSKGERLCTEHPVMAKFGAMFWRVQNRMKDTDLSVPVPYSVWTEFAAANPAVAAFTCNAARKYFDATAKELREPFEKTEAYANAQPEKNGGKWNKEISDNDLYLWKTGGQLKDIIKNA